jgi:hypothetical protein
MTKIEMIEDRYGPEDLSVSEIARMLKTPIKALRAEWAKADRAAAARERRWGNQKCRCGKLNKNCGDMFHMIENIEPWPSLGFDLPKTKAPGPVHEWVTEETK